MMPSAVEVKKCAAAPEMLGHVRQFDWTATTLGPDGKWPRNFVGVAESCGHGFMSRDKNLDVPALGTGAPLGFGCILEFYFRRHIAAGIDLGDTVVWYGTGIVIQSISGVGGSVVPRKWKQLQWNIGVSFWL